MSEQNTNMSERSMTPEEFEENTVPALNTIAELVLSHPDIPEEVDQSVLLSALTAATTELRKGLKGRVPEIVTLQESLARKDKQIQKLQDTNQQLFLKVGKYTDPNKKPEGNEPPPKKTFEEIRAMIEKL